MRDGIIKFVVFLAFVSMAVACPFLVSKAAGPAKVFEPQQQRRPQSNRSRTQGRRSRAQTSRQTARRDYSNFSHRVPQHQRECSSCHVFPTSNWNVVRKEKDAFPDITDYPQHASCVGCHREQYFRGTRPTICANCHVKTSPAGGERHPFPNPREIFDKTPKGQASHTEFTIYFPHDKHMEVVTAGGPRKTKERGPRFERASLPLSTSAEEAENCSVCHQTYQPQGDSGDEFVTPPPKDLPEDAVWLKKGTFKTTPTGHTTCFTCHAPDGVEPAPSNCNACHKLQPPQSVRADFDPKLAETMGIRDKITLEKWQKREAGRFRHEWFSHAELKCASCHDVVKLDTLDERTKKVPVISCGGTGGCHIGDPDSALNEAVAKKRADPQFRCTKCHVRFGLEPLPASHLNAVTNFKPE